MHNLQLSVHMFSRELFSSPIPWTAVVSNNSVLRQPEVTCTNTLGLRYTYFKQGYNEENLIMFL